MARIVRFSVAGLAGRDETFAQSLNHDVNVFFGSNGSGKTSLLKILYSAMARKAAILDSVPFEHAEVTVYSSKYDKEFTYELDKDSRKRGVKSSTHKEIDESAEVDTHVTSSRQRSKGRADWVLKSIKPHTETIPKVAGWRHRYLPTSRLYSDFVLSSAGRSGFIHRQNAISEERLDAIFAQSLNRRWMSYSAELLTAVRKAQEDGLASILKAILAPQVEERAVSDVDAETAYKRVAAFLHRQGSSKILGSREDFEKRYAKDRALRSVVSDINEVEANIELAMAPRERLQHLIQDMFSGNKSVLFQDTIIEVRAQDYIDIGLAALSSGEKQALRIFVETLQVEEGSFIIDEPEISMHIDWQRQLISSMQQLNPRAQIIVATHSPEIMADLDDDRIFRL